MNHQPLYAIREQDSSKGDDDQLLSDVHYQPQPLQSASKYSLYQSEEGSQQWFPATCRPKYDFDTTRQQNYSGSLDPEMVVKIFIDEEAEKTRKLALPLSIAALVMGGCCFCFSIPAIFKACKTDGSPSNYKKAINYALVAIAYGSMFYIALALWYGLKTYYEKEGITY